MRMFEPHEQMAGWISTNIYGDNILYVGAVLPRIATDLAHTGKSITVIDFHEEQINAGNRALFNETVSLRRKVEYILGDFLTYDFEKRPFSSIIIFDTEESKCEAFFAKARLLLDGMLMVITPSVSEGIDILDYFVPKRSKIIDGMNCILAEPRMNIDISEISMVFIKRAHENQKELNAIKQNLQKAAENEQYLNNHLMTLNEELRDSYTIKKELDHDLLRLKEREEGLCLKVSQLREREENLNQTVLQLKEQIEGLSAAVEDHMGKETELQAEITRLNGENQKRADELTNKIKDTERKKKAYQGELLRYKQKYNELLNSKRYRLGTAVSVMAKNPLMIFTYTRKVCKRVIKKILKQKEKTGANHKSGKQEYSYKGISVIIPTYKEQPYFEACVNSVFNQTIDPQKVEIIISVNGSDYAYYRSLEQEYREHKQVKVIYTEKSGASAGRNHAIKHVTMDYLTFLDDDDYFTPGYLQEMASFLDAETTIVCGRLVDECKSAIESDTYINNELNRISGGGKTKDYFSVGSLFSQMCAKLYKTELFMTFSSLNENVSHTEDILFWSDNFCKLTGYIYCCDGNGKEALVRRVLENSLSRPSEDKIITFWIQDRIDIIRYISEKLFSRDYNTLQKRFLLNKINSQTRQMVERFNSLDEVTKGKARALINEEDNFYLNKYKFSQIRGIAFCHNFSPTADASAYVAAKRLGEIGKLEGHNIKWDVISSDMSNMRKNDSLFDMFYTSFVINEHTVLKKPAHFNEQAQYRFACNAFEIMKDKSAEYIYSRSMFAGSHIAAYKYKEKHPDVIWYAEFSDPIYMGTDNKKRPTAKRYYGDEAFLNDFWKNCETVVYQYADVIIFTNDNQRKYMLSYNEEKHLNDGVLKKSILLAHPIIDKRFCCVINSDYMLDEAKINIGYFGSFYSNRKYLDMLSLLKKSNVVLHLFVPNPNDLKSLASERIIINSTVGHLEFLSIASKMNYLYLNDIDFEGDINPYLPSKLADYLATGTKIIAKINQNTVLSSYDHERIIKITDKSDYESLSITDDSKEKREDA